MLLYEWTREKHNRSVGLKERGEKGRRGRAEKHSKEREGGGGGGGREEGRERVGEGGESV